MSRARLGLYVFARVSLFQNCLELTPTFTQLVYRPLRLHLMPAEQHPTDRDVSTSTVHVVELSWDKMLLDPLKVTFLSFPWSLFQWGAFIVELSSHKLRLYLSRILHLVSSAWALMLLFLDQCWWSFQFRNWGIPRLIQIKCNIYDEWNRCIERTTPHWPFSI